MPPAFDSPRQAAAFAALLLFLLAAPWLAAEKFLPGADRSYSSESIRYERFPWAQKFIDQETNDIDIAFIGSSHIAHGINPAYVQAKLSEQLGRPAVVRTISFSNTGFDADYFFAKDLLAHRHVKTFVFYDEFSGLSTDEVHRYLPQWYRFGEDDAVLAGLPFRYRAIYYCAAVIGLPRNLLNPLAPRVPGEPDAPATGPMWSLHAIQHSEDPDANLGGFRDHLGFNPSYDIQNFNPHFIPFVPPARLTPNDACFYSASTASNFAFSDRSFPAGQLYFAREFALLVKSNGCNLVALHLPQFPERHSPVIVESRNWPDLMQTEVGVLGIPPQRLFAGLSEHEIELLYGDLAHLNLNGQDYYTPLITPALIQFYEIHSHH